MVILPERLRTTMSGATFEVSTWKLMIVLVLGVARNIAGCD
jgi:hypothetical protein